MHNSTKTTTFSVKKCHTCATTLKQQHLVLKRSHMHNNTKTETFGVKKSHTCKTILKQQHLVYRKVTHTQQHENNNI